MHEVCFFLYLLAINSKAEICLILIAFFIDDINNVQVGDRRAGVMVVTLQFALLFIQNYRKIINAQTCIPYPFQTKKRNFFSSLF